MKSFFLGVVLFGSSMAQGSVFVGRPGELPVIHTDSAGRAYPARFTSPMQREMRLRQRATLFQGSKALIDIDGANQASELVDGGRPLESLVEMDALGLRSAALAVTPWSDDYWAIYRGGLAARYADPERPDTVLWKDLYEYFQRHPLRTQKLRMLSPAEKYGLWIGDDEDTLTRQMWNEGRMYADSDGKVETWMGYCHGWAPASFMERRPVRKVVVPSADGRLQLEFFPADIKALATLLWAKASAETRFIGRRCQDKEPEMDEWGRPKKPDCFDVNAGAWHESVVTQIGVAKRSFVIDAAFDYEVWNQPVVKYEYTYFNPKTRQSASSLQEAQVRLSDFQEDRLKAKRAAKAVALVGVIMKLTYGVESEPLQAEDESSFEEPTRTVRYMYDVELDETDRIIGGEWYQAQHPDFMWVPAEGAAPLTWGDQLASDSGSTAIHMDRPLPPQWREAAKVSVRRAQPSLTLVRRLIRAAN